MLPTAAVNLVDSIQPWCITKSVCGHEELLDRSFFLLLLLLLCQLNYCLLLESSQSWQSCCLQLAQTADIGPSYAATVPMLVSIALTH